MQNSLLAQHYLCLVLQCLACLALNPDNHPALLHPQLHAVDSLVQLLLPSDEYYYTNHSTRYARYIKYHTARILVYLGQFQCIGGRIDLFDLSGIFTCIFNNKSQRAIALFLSRDMSFDICVARNLVQLSQWVG